MREPEWLLAALIAAADVATDAEADFVNAPVDQLAMVLGLGIHAGCSGFVAPRADGFLPTPLPEVVLSP